MNLYRTTNHLSQTTERDLSLIRTTIVSHPPNFIKFENTLTQTTQKEKEKTRTTIRTTSHQWGQTDNLQLRITFWNSSSNSSLCYHTNLYRINRNNWWRTFLKEVSLYTICKCRKERLFLSNLGNNSFSKCNKCRCSKSSSNNNSLVTLSNTLNSCKTSKTSTIND